MKQLLLLLIFLSLYSASRAQDTTAAITDSTRQVAIDSLRRRDSITVAAVRLRNDSILAAQVKKKVEQTQGLISRNQHFRVSNPALSLPMQRREKRSDDLLFYFLAGLVLYFALVRLFFSKYVSNLITLFFRATMRQQQIREQLLQTPLASLLLNILFVLAAALYLTFLAFHYRVSPYSNFWLVFLYCTGFIAALYTAKYVFLKFVGWIFGITTATDTYIFVVFLVNKIIGMLLLPVLVLMAFPNSDLYPVALVISYVVLVLLFLYRFFISYSPIRNDIKVNKFHFFLYLCAFEIAPLLLIYKVLLNFVERST